MKMFEGVYRTVDLAVNRTVAQVRQLAAWGKDNLERWTVNSGVFLLIATLALYLVFGNSDSARAQDTGLTGAIVNYFTPVKMDFNTVYRDNLKALGEFGCWGCNVFKAFSGSVFTVGQEVSAKGSAFSGLIVAIACCFSLFYVGSAFVSGDASDLLSRWKGFYRLMIAVAISTAFLNAGGGAFNNTWRIVYGPLLSVPLAVAREVNGAGGGSNCAVAVDVGADVAAAEQSLKAMEGVVCDSNAISMKGIAFGMALATSGSGNGFVAGILNALCGLIVMAIFFYVTITFPMRFIDVLVRLAVIGVLTPVLIVCATFKQSRAYVQIAVSNILYCGSVFAFTSILFDLGIRFFEQRMDAHINAMPTSSNTTIIGSSFEIIAMALIFASFSRTAVSLAQEFSQFRGSAGGAGDAATNFSNLIMSSGVKGGAAGSTVAIQSLARVIKNRGGGVSGGAGASQVGGGSASGSLGRGVSS